MSVLVIGAGLLVLAFIVQVALWRIALPERQTRALLVLFSVVPILVFGIASASGHPLVLSTAELARLGMMYVSCSLAYVVLYSAIEMQSPTLAIVLDIAARGSEGRTGADLLVRFGRDDPMAGRLAAMERSGWVCRNGDVLRLTAQGRGYARLFEHASTLVGVGRTKGG